MALSLVVSEIFNEILVNSQEAQLMLTRLEISQVIKHGTIRYAGIVSYYCPIVTFP